MKIKNITVLISGLAANQKLNLENGIDEIPNLESDTSDHHLFNHCEVLSLFYSLNVLERNISRNTLNMVNSRLVILK